jgi:hypothetical protein
MNMISPLIVFGIGYVFDFDFCLERLRDRLDLLLERLRDRLGFFPLFLFVFFRMDCDDFLALIAFEDLTFRGRLDLLTVVFFIVDDVTDCCFSGDLLTSSGCTLLSCFCNGGADSPNGTLLSSGGC